MLDPRASAVLVPVDISSLHIFHSYTEAHPTFQAYSHKISMAPHHCVYYSKTVFFFCCYVSNFIAFLQYYWSDISAITPDYRLTVEVKNIKEAAVITKLTSSPLEGKPVKENNCNIFY